MSNTTQQTPAPRTVKREDRAPQINAQRTRFVLHPSHRELGEKIDALNAERTLPHMDLAARTDTLNRQNVLITLARFPDGILPIPLCHAVIGSATAAQMQRLYALLAREQSNGTVEPTSGRGALRRISAHGRIVAADFEQAAARRQAATQSIARQVRESHYRRVNGVFDYARKIELGVISSLEPRQVLR